MQLDQLQLDLRPRPHAHALDLGLSLLRTHAWPVYQVWLTLWLPFFAIGVALAFLWPEACTYMTLLAWWLKPLLERAPLYVLSRRVFGEHVTWSEALRAWPSQLGGGWFRLLTWWRFFAPGRGLYQAIWQLEGARGSVASQRRFVIAGRDTGRAARWFGVVCAHFEFILEIGFIALVGLFLTNDASGSFWLEFFTQLTQEQSSTAVILWGLSYALAAGIMGPIYIACCFTLYLNRRATIEAWDLEIRLRQIQAPRHLAAWVGIALLCITLSAPETSHAAPPKHCPPPPELIQEQAQIEKERLPAHTPEQAALRQSLQALMHSDAVRTYRCDSVRRWIHKDKKPDQPSNPSRFPWWDINFAGILKWLAIACAVIAVVWLLLRHHQKLLQWLPARAPAAATIVAGLDIRPESLPPDVAARARQLWQQQRYREAMALLYRATLARLVQHHAMVIPQGATENDCLRLTQQHVAQGLLPEAHGQVVRQVTHLWQHGAYGHRWPDDTTALTLCQTWQHMFDTHQSRTGGQA